MTVLSTVFFYMASYTGCLVTGYIIANVLSKGFVWGITKVKVFGRRRGWVLVKVHTVSKPYYRVGTLKGDLLEYTPRHSKGPDGQKLVKTLTLSKGSIENNLGVDYIETDENSNTVLNVHNWKVVSGHDAELVTGLMKRIAMLPKSISKNEMWILIGVFLTLLVAAYTAFQVGALQGQVGALHGAVNALYNQTVSNAIAGSVGNLP